MRKSIFLLAFIFSIAIFLFACESKVDNDTTAAEVNTGLSPDSLVKRGEYLVSTMGCDDCHSPKNMTENGPELDMDHRLSGYPAMRPLPAVSKDALQAGWVLFVGDLTAAAGPWGVSFSANITPDPKTGIGNWTEEQFMRAIREGKSKGLEKSRPLLPPMPWQVYKNLTDEDISAIFNYLKTIKPVENIVPEPKQPGSF